MFQSAFPRRDSLVGAGEPIGVAGGQDRELVPGLPPRCRCPGRNGGCLRAPPSAISVGASRRDVGLGRHHHGAYVPRCVRLRATERAPAARPSLPVQSLAWSGCMRPTPLTSRSCRLMLACPCRPDCCTVARRVPSAQPCRGVVMCATEARGAAGVQFAPADVMSGRG